MNIYNELEYAEKLLMEGSKSPIPQRDLTIIAKYYKYLNYKPKQIESELEKYCSIYEEGYNYEWCFRRIKTALRESKKHSLKLKYDVGITQNELDFLKSINNYRYEKILFVMLVLGKFNMHFSQGSNILGWYYSNSKLSYIARLAKVYTKRDENLRNLFINNGWADRTEGQTKTRSYFYSYYVKFTSIVDNSESVLFVEDMDRIIDFYPVYCEQCGKRIDSAKNAKKKQRYCNDCQIKKSKEKRLKWWNNNH